MTAPFTVTVHPYPSTVRNACAYELGSPRKNALVFIGGLTDGPHTVPYIRTVAAKIQAAAAVDYSVFEIRIHSSFDGFGWGSLAEDVEDISAVVKYLRSIGKEKVVLMGHSTGCQVRRTFLARPWEGRAAIDVHCRIAWSTTDMTSMTTSLWMASSCRAPYPTGKATLIS